MNILLQHVNISPGLMIFNSRFGVISGKKRIIPVLTDTSEITANLDFISLKSKGF